jgi:hypothetical protein
MEMNRDSWRLVGMDGDCESVEFVDSGQALRGRIGIELRSLGIVALPCVYPAYIV